MKKNLLIIILIYVITLTLGSCGVYEDTTFHQDGKISYSLRFEADQFLSVNAKDFD